MKFTPNLSKTEWKSGLTALAVTMFLLPSLLSLIPGLSGARLNFISYGVCAVTAVVFLRRFLGKNLLVALDHPFATLYLAALGYLASQVLIEMVGYLVLFTLPDYVNFNNQTIQTLFSSDLPLMLAATVVFAPIAEECLFRGLLFRGIYDRSPAAAWIISVVLFAFAHVAGYLGSYSLAQLLASMLLYVPAGIVLNVTYRRSGNILAPIITHAIVNLMAALAAAR